MILLSAGPDLLLALLRAERSAPDSAWLLFGPSEAVVEPDDCADELPLAAE
jgi:hypothetical protein